MKIEVAKSHNLDVDLVVQRVKKLFAKEQEKFGHLASSIEHEWENNILATRLSAYGHDCSLITQVQSDKVSVEADVPWALALFKRKIVRMIEFRLGRVCAQVRAK